MQTVTDDLASVHGSVNTFNTKLLGSTLIRKQPRLPCKMTSMISGLVSSPTSAVIFKPRFRTRPARRFRLLITPSKKLWRASPTTGVLCLYLHLMRLRMMQQWMAITRPPMLVTILLMKMMCLTLMPTWLRANARPTPRCIQPPCPLVDCLSMCPTCPIVVSQIIHVLVFTTFGLNPKRIMTHDPGIMHHMSPLATTRPFDK